VALGDLRLLEEEVVPVTMADQALVYSLGAGQELEMMMSTPSTMRTLLRMSS